MAQMVEFSSMSWNSLYLTSNDTKESKLDAWLLIASFWTHVPLFSFIISSYFDKCMIYIGMDNVLMY